MELIQFTETVKTKEEVGWREKNNNSGIYKVWDGYKIWSGNVK